jgi:succinyldiaminopimelate transaminase
VFDGLPEYPWQKLAPYKQVAQQHPDGLVDLSIGSPVDDTPEIVQAALADSSNSAGYPSATGTKQLQEAIVAWFRERRSVELSPSQVMPTVGSKELISWLPVMLGLGPGDVVVQPKLAYTAYEVGAKFAGCDLVSEDDPELWPANTKLIWINSPANPNGSVMSQAQMRKAVIRARELDAVLVSDECYAELGWQEGYESKATPCLLADEVTGGDLKNLLAIYSLSKQSNLAGYRAALAGGDEELIQRLINLRKHAGLIVPAPIQSAMVAALGDYQHVARQKEIYRKRIGLLSEALQSAGYEIADCQGGLYLWVKVNDTFEAVAEFANLGILVGPGEFYGEAGAGFVRIAVTAIDEDIQRASRRLKML